MTDNSWRFGHICLADEGVNLDHSILMAEVHSKALRPDDGGYIACYVLVDQLEPGQAERAMQFFSSQASLLVDVSALAQDCGADFPALVTIRYSDEARKHIASACEFETLRELPNDSVISRDGWDLFCAQDAIERGLNVPLVAAIPPYDYRALRRKVYVNRASVKEDRSPWLVEELAQLRELTAHSPEGSEALVAMADDMEAAMNGSVEVGHSFSIIIPTKVERGEYDGAVYGWTQQTGREIVVAHGLDATQAAHALASVRAAPEKFVSAADLLSSKDARETILPAFAIPDTGLNWISTDFTGRRNHTAYEQMRAALGTALSSDFTQSLPSRGSNER